MPVVYTSAVKIARMNAVTAAAGATAVLEIGTTAMGTVLATIALGNPIAAAATGAGLLTLSGFPRSDTAADATGKGLAARLRTASGSTDIVTGLDVGLSLTAAPAWVASTAVSAGVYRSNGANVYKCVTAGTTAASGGPTGTGTAITDGSAVWDWYCKAAADVQMDSLEITAGQTVQIDSLTFTHA